MCLAISADNLTHLTATAALHSPVPREGPELGVAPAAVYLKNQNNVIIRHGSEINKVNPEVIYIIW